MYHKHFNVNFSIIYALIPISNLGYVILNDARSVNEVIIATKLTYIGGCFLILFMTFYIFDMCDLKLDKQMKLSMFITCMVIYIFSLTIGKSTIFYKSIKLSVEDGIIAVHKEYGPLHTACYLLIAVLFVMGITAIVYSFRKKKQVSRKIILFLFIPEIIAFISFFGGRAFTNKIELLPLSYVVAQFMYLMIAHYTCMYDINDTAIDTLIESGKTGFVSFDFNLNYIGSNNVARDIFVELNDLTVDRPLRNSTALYIRFIPWINAFKKDNSLDKYYYSVNGHTYLININYLMHGKDKNGYQFVITDDTKNQEYIKLINNYNANLEEEVQEKTANIVKMHNNLIRSMAKLVESRDNSTGGHIIRTSDVVAFLMDEIMKDKNFTDEFNIDSEFRDNIIKAAPLHDIGKIAIDDAILRKPGRFTDEEFEIMKNHAACGGEVLQSILDDTDDEEFKQLAENVATYHHERMDGSGYPKGLKGDAIPIEARIMAIADVYDALVSKRVYKDSMSFDKANAIMMDSMGKHFDERLKKFYLAALPRIVEYYSSQEE